MEWINIKKQIPPNCANDKKNSPLSQAIESELELYEEPEQLYTFAECIPFLKQGKRMKRIKWCKYLLLSMDSDGTFYNCNGGLHLDIEDLEATDWIVLDE